MTLDELTQTAWAQQWRCRSPRSWNQVLGYLKQPDFAVRLAYDRSEQAWDITPVVGGVPSGLWLDYYDTEGEAVEACLEREWRIWKP
jgi:hypothetical protein